MRSLNTWWKTALIEQYDAQVSLPNSQEVNDTVLNIPLHQNLSNDDVTYIMNTIHNFSKRTIEV